VERHDSAPFTLALAPETGHPQKPVRQTRNLPQSRALAQKYSLLRRRNTLKMHGFIPYVSAGSSNQAGAEIQRSFAMKLASFAIAVTLALTPAVVFAQTAPNRPDPTINQRKANQQDRIAQGVKSGELSAGQAARLEHQEAGINKEERGMRAQGNGHLTSQDRKVIHHQQNVESHRIYRAKH
jgi:hypothetical protein